MKKFKLLTVLCLAFVMLFGLGVATTTSFHDQKTAYADTTASDLTRPLFAVNFYIAGKFYTQYILNQGQSITKPTDFNSEAASYNWLKDNNASDIFDFSTQTVGTSAINLYLQLDANKKAVIFYKENPNYDATVSTSDKSYLSKKDQYSISFVEIIDKNGTVAEPNSSKNPSKDGYNFSHWGTSEISDAEYDFTTPVADTLSLYPKYTIKTFTVQFLVNGTEFNKQTVNYNALAVDPGVPTSEGEVFSHWYVQGDVTKTAIIISSQTVQQDYILVAEFTSAQLEVTINSFVYGSIVDSTGNIVDTSVPLYATNGTNYVFYIQLNENYNEFDLKKSNIAIDGTYVSYTCEHPSNSADGFYQITVRTVRSNLAITVSGVTVNKYDVTMTVVSGVDITIITSDYTVTNNVYTLDFTVEFKFRIAINANYELAEGEISVSNCEYNEVEDCYVLTTSNADKTVVVQGDVREVVTITMTGINNVTVTITDSTYIIATPDEYVYRVEKGKTFRFSATTTGTYYLRAPSNATASAGGYTVTADVDKIVEFTVVDTVEITVPSYFSSVETYAAVGHLSSRFEYGIQSNIYRMELGTTLTLTFTMKAEYSQAVLDITCDSGEVNVTDFPVVYISNIAATGTVVVAEPNKNTYVTTLINNDMVTLTDAAGTNRAVHGGSVTINIQKSAAYSNAAISGDNITILGSYTGYNVADDNNSITITGITSAITLYVENLSKNKYSVILNSSDVYGTLQSTNSLVEYGTSFTFIVSLQAPYSKTAINSNIFNIVSSVNGTVASNDLTIEGSTVSIQNITQSLTVSLKELSLNTYRMTLPSEVNGQYTISAENDTVVYNETFQFSLTLTSAYSKNAETMTVTRKIGTSAVEVEPIIEGNVLTYVVENVVSNLTFSVSTLSLNIYSINFYDTDPIEIVKTVKVQHGQQLLEVPTMTKVGSTFNFWAYDIYGASPVDFNSAIYQDTDCYAIFATRTFIVTFKDHVGSREVVVNYGKACEIPTIRPKEGYDNCYWDIGDNNINAVTVEGIVIEAIYIQNTYVVLFKNGDTIHSRQMILHGESAETPNNPERKGHRFIGWNKSYSTIVADTTIEAKFEVIPYMVYFYNANKNNTLLLSFQVNYGETVFEPQQNADNRSKYTFRYKDLSTGNVLSADKVLDEGYVLEGWYADEYLSIKYNFDDTVNGELHIYGNMKVTQMLVTFFVDGKFYTEKAVSYKGTLTNVPAVPHRVGYDQVAPQWVIRGGRNDYANLTTDIQVDAVYKINEYTLKFVFPGGKEQYTRTVTHGGTVVNVPLPATRFGEILIYDKDATRYVTDDATIYITVIDLVPYLVAIAAAGALALVVVGMAIAISTMKRNRQDTKKMEQLIKDIREQDKRLTQINERKLRAQVDAEMKRKEKINKNKFLE